MRQNQADKQVPKQIQFYFVSWTDDFMGVLVHVTSNSSYSIRIRQIWNMPTFYGNRVKRLAAEMSRQVIQEWPEITTFWHVQKNIAFTKTAYISEQARSRTGMQIRNWEYNSKQKKYCQAGNLPILMCRYNKREVCKQSSSINIHTHRYGLNRLKLHKIAGSKSSAIDPIAIWEGSHM